MCRVLAVHPSGFYAWLKHPLSNRAKTNQKLVTMIKQSWLASGLTYGSRRIHQDLRELGETCSEGRVERLMRKHKIQSQRGYKRRYVKSGQPSHVAPNQLKQRFEVDQPNYTWVTDITYIRTYEGWFYLAVVVDLFSRKVVGWSMNQRMEKHLVTQALLSAVWQRKPEQSVIVHSDQGAQYTSDECLRFMKHHNFEPSMSRRGNCYDNAVVESFFHSLKSERIKRKIYKTREQARQDIFDYIEWFYNPIRRHSSCDNMSPIQYEQTYYSRLKSV